MKSDNNTTTPTLTVEQAKQFTIQLLQQLMPAHKELEAFDPKCKDVIKAIIFGGDKARQLERLAYQRCIDEMDSLMMDYLNLISNNKNTSK